MKSAHKYGVAFLSILLFGSTGLSTSANAGGSIPESIPYLGLDLRENGELGRMPSVLYGQLDPNNQSTWYICNGISDKNCIDASGIFGFSNWDICTELSAIACVSEVWATDSTGKKINGEFVKRVPVDPRYEVKENIEVGIPESKGIGALWRIPGVLNSAGKDTYFVSVQSVINAQKTAGAPVSKVFLGDLIAGITPVEEMSGNFQLLTALDGRGNPNAAWGSNGTRYAPDGTVCMATEYTICEATRQFPAGYRFGLTLRMGAKAEGWFHGRLYLPNITTKEWKSGQEISIEAEPVKVPALDFTVPASQIPDPVKKIVFSGIMLGNKGNPNGGMQISENLSGPYTLDLVSAFAPAYNDKATTTETYWSFKTLNPGNDQTTRACSDKSGNLAGLVTTNALAYAAGPPVFDSASGSLTYKVSSPHFEASGVEASGSYDLTLRSDVARCVYGFTKAPIQAEISITSQDGEKKVATTIVNEKNGWLYMSAKGFTFSSPIINVKLSQEKEVVILPTPTPTPTPISTPTPSVTSKPVAKKSVSINCVKGKVSKKISGTNPKCPAGYKKK